MRDYALRTTKIALRNSRKKHSTYPDQSPDKRSHHAGHVNYANKCSTFVQIMDEPTPLF